MDLPTASYALALATGIALAAASGLRAFLPLLALGLAAHFGVLHLRPGLDWLAGTPALVALGVATVLEIAADKIPVLDHALDAAGAVVRPAAAFVATYAVLADWGSPWAQLTALLLGAGAFAVQAAKAKTRLGSTALTLGHANPLLSVAEDVATTALAVVAVLLPALALLLVVLLGWGAVRLLRGRARPA